MRPSKGTLRKTSMFLTEAQFDALHGLAQRNATNVSQLVRDFVRAGLRRESRKK
jgi:hypothetical protein